MKMIMLSTQSAYLLVWHKHNTSHQIHSSWYESSSFITVFYTIHQSASLAVTAKYKMLADFQGCQLTAICSLFRVIGYQQSTHKNNYKHLELNSGYILCTRSAILVHTSAINGVALGICTEFEPSFIIRNYTAMSIENHYVTLLVSLSDMGGSIALEGF